MKEMNSFTKRKAENGGECVLTESELTFDKKFKQLFLKKELLAPILKNVVLEYKDCALEEIEGYITTHGDQSVNPELYSSEDAGKGDEVPTHYDVLVDCSLPDGSIAYTNVFFDLEMQREGDPGYPVVKRGVYYCCRLISRQIEKLSEESCISANPYEYIVNPYKQRGCRLRGVRQ